MAERRRYANPPIEEALCEFRFQPGRPWDVAVADGVHDLLRGEYDGGLREQREIQVEVSGRAGSAPTVGVSEGGAAKQLSNVGGTRLVGVAADTLRVHMLRPYVQSNGRGGWEEFRPRIVRALDAYWQVAEPEGVSRVGVRYVNKILVKSRRVSVEDYLPYALPVVPEMSDAVTNFGTRIEYAYAKGVRLILSQGTLGARQEGGALLLDIDVIRDGGCFGKDVALEIVEDLRDRERDVFEAVITDEARRLFDAD